MRGHGWNVSGRKPGTDGFAAAQCSREVLRSRGSGGHHSARPDCWKNDASLHAAAAGKRIGDLRSPVARTGTETNSGCAALSGTTAPYGDDCGELHRG